MTRSGKPIYKKLLILFTGGFFIVLITAAILIIRTRGRTLIQIDIHQNKELIHLSTFAEPPQFAIWLENPETQELKRCFCNSQVAVGDWEGKANVPVCITSVVQTFQRQRKSFIIRRFPIKNQYVISGQLQRQTIFRSGKR
jgi:hypothetical protein